jgi:hypothetical protein
MFVCMFSALSNPWYGTDNDKKNSFVSSSLVYGYVVVSCSIDVFTYSPSRVKLTEAKQENRAA